jgi:hypothetical protein
MDRKAMQAAAHDYPYLRGLFGIPGGVLFLVAALGNARWGPLKHDWVFIAALVVLVGAGYAVHRHYERRYGRVTPTRRSTVAGGAMLAVAIAVGIGGTIALHGLPINALAALYGAITLVYYALFVGARPHHIAIWGSLLVAGALPVWTGGDPSNVALVLIGVATIVNGVFDHLTLNRTLAAARVGG